MARWSMAVSSLMHTLLCAWLISEQIGISPTSKGLIVTIYFLNQNMRRKHDIIWTHVRSQDTGERMLIGEYNSILFADTYKLTWIPLSYLFSKWWIKECIVTLHPSHWTGYDNEQPFNYLPDLADDEDWKSNWLIGFLRFFGFFSWL